MILSLIQKDTMYVRVDRRRKLPVTTFLMALEDNVNDKVDAKNKISEYKPCSKGMSREEILTTFYNTIVYTKDKRVGLLTLKLNYGRVLN